MRAMTKTTLACGRGAAGHSCLASGRTWGCCAPCRSPSSCIPAVNADATTTSTSTSTSSHACRRTSRQGAHQVAGSWGAALGPWGRSISHLHRRCTSSTSDVSGSTDRGFGSRTGAGISACGCVRGGSCCCIRWGLPAGRRPPVAPLLAWRWRLLVLRLHE